MRRNFSAHCLAHSRYSINVQEGRQRNPAPSSSSVTLGKPPTFPSADQESKRGLTRASPALASRAPVRAARVGERGSEAVWLRLGGHSGNTGFLRLSDEGELTQLLTLRFDGSHGFQRPSQPPLSIICTFSESLSPVTQTTLTPSPDKKPN